MPVEPYRVDDFAGYIYVTQRPSDAEKGIFKIGRTTRKMTRRLGALNTGTHESLEVKRLYGVDKPVAVEKYLHALFDGHGRRVKREFFTLKSASEVDKALESSGLAYENVTNREQIDPPNPDMDRDDQRRRKKRISGVATQEIDRLDGFLRLRMSKIRSGYHDIYTPLYLCGEVIDELDKQVKGRLKDKLILVLYNVEFAVMLKHHGGVDMSNVYYCGEAPLQRNVFCGDLGAPNRNWINIADRERFLNNFSAIIERKTGMAKFDVCVMNPPYKSNRGVKLYAEFFEKALETADVVASVMPYKLESGDKKLVRHNNNVLEHQMHIGSDVRRYFDISTDQVRTVIASKGRRNKYEPILTSGEILERIKRHRADARCIPFISHRAPLHKPEVWDENGQFEILLRINKGEHGITPVFRSISGDGYKKIPEDKKVKSPYVVFVNLTASDGKLSVYVHDNKKREIVSWADCFVVDHEFKSWREAVKLAKWLQSDHITDDVRFLQKATKQLTGKVSVTMLRLLPWYPSNWK